MKRAKQAKKKTVRKVVRRKAKAEDKTPRKADPFVLDERLIPTGWAYAWKVNERPGGLLPPGWSPVPYSRHAHNFPRSYQNGSYIVFNGLILVEAPIQQVLAETRALTQKAIDQVQDRADQLHFKEGGAGFYIVPSSWVESEEIPVTAYQNEGSPVQVDVTLAIRVPVRWRSAAQYLKLPLEEYARRRILQERLVLGALDQFEAVPIYEPITLQFSARFPFQQTKED